MKRNSCSGAAANGGFTLTEVTVAGGLFLAVLLASYQTIITVADANQRTSAKIAEETRYRDFLEKIATELRRAGTDTDPMTGDRRYRTWVDTTTGRSAFSISVLESATASTGEIRPLWSPPITYTTDARGRVVRSQNGASRVVADHVAKLSLEVSPHGRFLLTCVTYETIKITPDSKPPVDENGLLTLLTKEHRLLRVQPTEWLRDPSLGRPVKLHRYRNAIKPFN